MRESFAAVVASERLFAAVYADVLFQMVLELERFITIRTFEFPQQCRFVVTNHVTLQPVHIGEGLVADFAALQWNGKRKTNY